MTTDRKVTLLKAALELLKNCEDGPYVKHALSETVFYDGAECDGYCLANDIASELGEEEPFRHRAGGTMTRSSLNIDALMNDPRRHPSVTRRILVRRLNTSMGTTQSLTTPVQPRGSKRNGPWRRWRDKP